MRVFSDLILNTRDPVYLQLVRYVHLQICRGVLRDGDALPSRRELAVLLGINPNTAQKAYKALEEECRAVGNTQGRSRANIFIQRESIGPLFSTVHRTAD